MSVSLREKKPSGRQWSPDFCCMTPPIWVSEASVAKESSAFGQDVGGAPPPQGDVLHFGMPPVQKRSTPTFWPHPSGDQLKVSKFERTWAENGGKSVPCQGNVAVV